MLGAVQSFLEAIRGYKSIKMASSLSFGMTYIFNNLKKLPALWNSSLIGEIVTNTKDVRP